MQYLTPFLAEKNKIKQDNLLRRMFSYYDKDHNEIIDRKEFTAFYVDLLKELKVIPRESTAASISGDDIVQFLTVVDANHDDKISLQEFIKFWSHPMLKNLKEKESKGAKRLQRQKSFDVVSKSLKFNEVSALFDQVIGEKNSEQQLSLIAEVFATYDADKNKVLDYFEFSKFVMHLFKAYGLPKPTEENIQEFLEVIDLDQSGDIDLEEFGVWWVDMMEALNTSLKVEKAQKKK